MSTTVDGEFTLKNLRHRPEFSALAGVIKRVAGDAPLLFVPSPGNWGDSLINEGTRQFLHHYGIEFEECLRATAKFTLQSKKYSTLVVGGGGGWCTFWHSTPQFVLEHIEHVEHVIVMPSTYEHEYLYGLDKDPRVILFSRGSPLSNSDTAFHFCHDMAFFLQMGELGFNPVVESPIYGRLTAFRLDKESAHDERRAHERNFDLSLLGNGFSSPEILFTLISRFSSVQTDRLHIGLVAALLGKNANLHTSAYGKIPAVYHTSINGFYPYINLVELSG